MIEKRFELGYVCGDYGLIDNHAKKGKWTNFHSMSANSEKNVYICIQKLNEVADEIDQLKIENEHYKSLFVKIVENALKDKHCRELYCDGLLEIFKKANSLNQAREMVKAQLK